MDFFFLHSLGAKNGEGGGGLFISFLPLPSSQLALIAHPEPQKVLSWLLPQLEVSIVSEQSALSFLTTRLLCLLCTVYSVAFGCWLQPSSDRSAFA